MNQNLFGFHILMMDSWGKNQKVLMVFLHLSHLLLVHWEFLCVKDFWFQQQQKNSYKFFLFGNIAN